MNDLPTNIDPELEPLDNTDRLHDFYTVDFDFNKNIVRDIKLDRLKIIELLRQLGYLRYDMEDGNSTFVHIDDNKIELTTDKQIVDAFEDYVLNLPSKEYEFTIKDGIKKVAITPRRIQESLYRNIQAYFSVTLERLRPESPISILGDTRHQKYFYFDNLAVEVIRDGIKTVPYNSLEGKIWKSAIVPRNFTYTDTKGDFEVFCEDISGNDEERKLSLMSMLGYLMHDFYECQLRAVLFTDVNKTDVGADAGRTGKGVIGKALDQMLNRNRTDAKYCSIPAKALQLDKDTRYSLADMSTQLLHLEDVAKNFDFEMLYNDITDGATIRKPYQIKPIIRKTKIMISINKTIEIKGSSTRGRLAIFELANYYSDNFSPEQKFGRRFFETDWKADDWNRFYSFMCRCSLVHMQQGLILAKEINYSTRNLLESVPEDFVYWFGKIIEQHAIDRSEKEFSKNALFASFIEKYTDYNNPKFRQATFSKWCKKYCNLKSIPHCSYRGTTDMFVIFPSEVTYSKSRTQLAEL